MVAQINFFLYMEFFCLNDPMYDSKLSQFFIMQLQIVMSDSWHVLV
jgi:hypothetical protein